MSCDVDFCGDGTFERILVERVEPFAEVASVAPDFGAGQAVYYKGGGEGDPVVC